MVGVNCLLVELKKSNSSDDSKTHAFLQDEEWCVTSKHRICQSDKNSK